MYMDIKWVVKIKTDSAGNVHFEEEKGASGERTVLTKPKILTVAFTWKDIIERRNAATRYVLSAADYQRLLGAVK